MIYSFYRTSDGSVTKVIHGDPDQLILNLEEDEGMVEGDYLGFRVDLETGDRLPLMTFDVVSETNRLSNVPVGAFVQVEFEQPFKMDESGVVVFDDIDHVETVPVTFTHPLYETRTEELSFAPVP